MSSKKYIGGSIQIVDGTQGDGKILMSDSVGISSWSTFSIATASSESIGGVIVGIGLTVSNVGVLSLSGGVRVQSVTSSVTVTPVSTNDLVKITEQSDGLTLVNPTGTFSEGQALMIRIKDNGTARTITFDTNYRAIGVTLPTTTVISKTLYLGIIYNSTDSKWDVVGYNIQA